MSEEDGIKGTEDEGILDVLNDKSASFYKSDFFWYSVQMVRIVYNSRIHDWMQN